MLEKKNENIFTFTVKSKEYEVFFADDGEVEIYETKEPGKTGFIFSNSKKFLIFINMLTDIMERMMENQTVIKNGCEDE